MFRTGRIAVALVAALAAPAAVAQWRTDPMVVWLEQPGLDVLAGAFGAGPGSDGLLVLDQARDVARERLHHALLAPLASPFPLSSLPLERAFRSGYLSQDGADGLADVASHYATGGVSNPPSRIDLVLGSDPSTVRSFGLPLRTDAGG